MIHTSIANAKPREKDGRLVTSEFIGLTKYYILQDIFSIKQEHGPKFGDLVICLDKSQNGYWRNDVFPAYKAGRREGRDESNINYSEVFAEIDALTEQIKTNLPIKVVEVPRTEADDIMLVLAREYNKYENILIHSPDKDMIQAQRNNNTVFQYSALTKKWLVPENKHDNMEHWIMEHVCLGDGADGIPKIIEHTEFSTAFLHYLKEHGYEEITSPMEFKSSTIPIEEKHRLLTEFNVFKTNRKGESTGVKDVYKDTRFGSSNLLKKINEFGSLDKWLDSHPLYRKNYERNFTLVMEEGIPTNIWNEIILAHKEAETVYNDREFEEYLIQNDLKSILMDLPGIFKITRNLTASDFGW